MTGGCETYLALGVFLCSKKAALFQKASVIEKAYNLDLLAGSSTISS
jgi:hypothetical protein